MNYSDITILKFQEIQSAIEMNPDNVIAQWYNILPLLTDKTKEDYQLMKFTDFQKVIKEFEWMDSFSHADKFIPEFECQGEHFYVTQYPTDWNTEQFISMSTLTKDRSQIVNNLHLILATLCYKDKKEIIDMTEFDRRSKMFQDHLNILIAYPIGFFFALLLAKLSQSTPYSSHLKKMEKKMNQLNKGKPLQENGAGISLSIRSLQKKTGRSLNTTRK